jgi:Xaa-Pro aminopeptidase
MTWGVDMGDLPSFGMEVIRFREALAADGLDVVLLSEPASICCATAFAVPLPIGAGAAFAAGPILALVSRDTTGLLVSSSEAGLAQLESRAEHLAVYTPFDHENPIDARAEFAAGVDRLLNAVVSSHATIALGIEPRSLPAMVAAHLADRYPQLVIRDATTAVARARLVKTPRQIALLRFAARAADAGQRALLAQARSGASELTLWNALHGAIEATAGGPVPITGELVSGPCTSVVRYPGGPSSRVVEQGDTIICDISPCVSGYYADCCNTLVVGDPSVEQLHYFYAAREACEAAMLALRPGNLASDSFEAARAALARHGLPVAHYAGHGIGASVNELPRLVPHDRTPIEAGMVFAVEPGAYAGENGTTGARTEKMVLVTPDGPEVVSQFAWGLS